MVYKKNISDMRMRQRPISMPALGLAKVQRLPYACWDELKMLRSRDAAFQFMMAHKESERIFARELGEGSFKRIIGKGKFKDNSDRDFADETCKSCILRAAGSAKASWNTWSVSPNGFSYQSHGPDFSVKIVQNANQYLFDFPYEINLGRQEFESIKEAARLLVERLDPGGEKRILRMDFALEAAGKSVLPWLVDFGESHYTFVLGTHFHAALGANEDFISRYLDAVGLPDGSGRVWMVYQSDNALCGMPWEIEGIKSAIEARGNKANPISLEDFISLPMGSISPKDRVLRFFRQADEDTFMELNRLVPSVHMFADPLKFIPRLQKASVHRLVESMLQELSQLVRVPKAALFPLESHFLSIVGKIAQWAGKEEVDEIVVKPGQGKMQPNAFFYRLENPHHIEELGRTIRKMQKNGASEAVVEQLVGNSAIDGRKAELRFWIFS